MSFFIRGKNKSSQKGEKRKKIARGGPSASSEPKNKKRASSVDDEEIDSDLESDEDLKNKAKHSSDDDEEVEETAQEKKLRLAKQYLAQLDAEEADKNSYEETRKELIAHRLQQDVLEQAGKLEKKVANDYLPPEAGDTSVLRGHQLSITCLVISPDNKYIFSAAKDCNIIKWDIAAGQRLHVIKGAKKGKPGKCHTAKILCLAISSDGDFLVSGGMDKMIHVWNPDTCEWIHTLKGHRDAVSGLAFRKESRQLFSASHDRAVKVWTLDEMAYVETLFGHQDVITDIDSLTRERAITTGGRDGSVRIWKIMEESQLVFHGHQGSIDCVSLINEQYFVTGADDNSIALWGLMKKKPLVRVKNAHSGPETSETPGDMSENWISAVTSLQHTDLVASGSRDGCIRLWRCGEKYKSLIPLFSIPVNGFVNSLKFTSDGSHLIAGVGQEHKWGRWWRLKDAKNSIVIIKLSKKTT